MICIICSKQAGYKKNVCDDCLKVSKIKCKDCGIESKFESEFYTYSKTNKKYKVCKDCFNKKIECEGCNKMINKTYIKRHIKKCLIKKWDLVWKDNK